MNFQIVQRIIIIVGMIAVASINAIIIEYTKRASGQKFYLEIKNKSNVDIECIIYADTEAIVHETVKKHNLSRSPVIRIGDLDAENSLSIKIWPAGAPAKAKHYELPLDKTIYVKYKNGNLVPQKGHKTSVKEIRKTKSGLSLIDNLEQGDMQEWRPISTFNND
ncbi:hypothetical protein Noda2021_11540 [Candidatus Dependentiae bacterium Noda2021]|nr:hypothetical protein Noda2021_11540 [Candidatus Dependentiae bacterium Noda2021]